VSQWDEYRNLSLIWIIGNEGENAQGGSDPMKWYQVVQDVNSAPNEGPKLIIKG
jgi:hypothetical protein